jgi:hypothetical protein
MEVVSIELAARRFSSSVRTFLRLRFLGGVDLGIKRVEARDCPQAP